MGKIDKLTPEQQADIQPTIANWLQYSRETDRIKQRETVEELYRRYISDGKTPLVVHVQSPIQAMVLAKIWKPFWADFVPKLSKAGINVKGASLDASLRDSLDASLRASLDASLRASLDASLRDSLDASLRDSLGASLRASLGDSLGDSLGASLRDSLDASLRDSLDASLRASLGASLRASLDASLDASLRDSLGASLDASLRDSLGDSLGDSLRASLRDSLGDSLGDSLRASLRASLDASLDASLRDSLRASLDASLDASLGASLDAEYSSLLRVYWRVHRWYYSGVSVVDFVLRHFGNHPDLKINLTDVRLWVDVGKFLGLVLPYSRNMCIVIDNPKRTAFEQGVLSYDHGKAVEYSDGWGYYMLKGVRLTEQQFNDITSGKLTLPEIAQKNWGADVSSVAIQFLGADQLIKGMNGKLIATGMKHRATLERLGEDKCHESYQWAFRPDTELYQIDDFMDTGRTEYCIKMWHPTVEDAIYVEWVDPEIGKMKDADLAQATAFSITKQEYLVSYEA